jgi:hypothetical protein
MMHPAFVKKIAFNILLWRAKYGYNRTQEEIERRFPAGFTAEERQAIYDEIHGRRNAGTQQR